MKKKDYEKYVKEELWKDFEKSCKLNCLDFYSCGVVLSAHLVMKNLMQHKIKGITKKDELSLELSLEEAWDSAMKETSYHSGNTAAMVAFMVYKYSTRGKEFKKWWNKRCGGTGDEEGTVNPAFVTIGGKEK